MTVMSGVQITTFDSKVKINKRLTPALSLIAWEHSYYESLGANNTQCVANLDQRCIYTCRHGLQRWSLNIATDTIYKFWALS